MNLFVLDTEFQTLAVIDTYKSIIWTDRYDECGDFELYTLMEDGILEYIKQDHYLWNPESEHVMIIEKLLITSDVEEGNVLTVSGRSVESILNRRVVWGRLRINGNLQDGVKALLDACFINPEDENRKIDNLVFEYSTDSAITDLTLTAQYTGDNLYDVIHKICNEFGLGFKMVLNDDMQFVFKLYSGADRSYNQIVNPYVVFSPKFDNLLNSNYIESKSALKTCTLIGGEGEGTERKFASVGGGTGMDRREMFTDARDISSDLGDGECLSDEDYEVLLIQRGKEKLTENTDIVSFEGEIEPTSMFQYGEDYFIGDIVQIANEHGHEATARIGEIVISEDETGRSVYPTLVNPNGEE